MTPKQVTASYCHYYSGGGEALWMCGERAYQTERTPCAKAIGSSVPDRDEGGIAKKPVCKDSGLQAEGQWGATHSRF